MAAMENVVDFSQALPVKCQSCVSPNRLHHMSNDKLVKKVYCDLVEPNDQRITTWPTDALKLVNDLGLDLNDVQKTIDCKHAVQSN